MTSLNTSITTIVETETMTLEQQTSEDKTEEQNTIEERDPILYRAFWDLRAYARSYWDMDFMPY